MMKKINGLTEQIRLPENGVVATIGTFDGVHMGHQHVLGDLIEWGQQINCDPMVITFNTPPQSIVGKKKPQMITSLEHRLFLFERLGVKHTLILDFDENLSRMSAEDFVSEILVERIGIRGMLLGFDCRWGKDHKGNFALMQKLGEKYNFMTRLSEKIEQNGGKIGSTNIRKAILSGELELAAKMLGRPVSILGTVVHGHKRGKSMGFPTANLDLHHEICPPPGVYATGCRIGRENICSDKGEIRLAMTYIGKAPTFGSSVPEPRAETHILDFNEKIYDENIEVVFFSKIRDDRRFDSPEELQAQIASDEMNVRGLLQSGKSRG